MSSKVTTINRPSDQGRRMSLEEFEVVVRPPAGYKTRLLPGLEFSIAKVLESVAGHGS